MPTTALPPWKDFLAQPVVPGCKDHMVQFYHAESFLAETVGHFVAAGLGLGEAVLVIATLQHEQAIREELSRLDQDTEAALTRGQLIILDAETTLRAFMVNGLPDWKKFSVFFTGILERAASRFRRVRAFGEMVDLLRAEGRHEAMIKLEEFWNELSRIHSFSLLCGYSLDGFAKESAADVFGNVCQVHSHVLPAETVAMIRDSEIRNRTIASLQRRAAALESEIEERKRAEKSLLDSQASLQEAVRSRDEFLSIASHELKTPIAALKLHSQILQRRYEKNDSSFPDRSQVEKFLAVTSRQVDRLATLVDDILDISRIAHGKLYIEPVDLDLGDLVKEVLDRYAEQLKAQGFQHRLTLEPSLRGQWDRDRIEQVVTNLITNAMKYAAGKPVEISVTAEGPSALLRVRDQGPGIDAENLERIFGRFERAVSFRGVSGLGLGLFISRQIVEAHGGKIWAESEPGVGSCFVVRLPLPRLEARAEMPKG